ncbi:hypothetical protein FXO38_02342 [Capsicum annuum]|nr:hypothetical protein FXO37_24724 [Capsicum annuum]KAF3680362.1 hypothetical protein FXO38_02342 [Capsicum annuum]
MTLKLPMCRFYSSSLFSCKLPYTTRKLSARWLELKIRNYVSGHVFGKLEVGHVVMNQVQPNVDTMVTQVLIGLTRAIGPRTSNRARVSLAVIACLVDKCETEEDAVSGFASDLDDDNSNSTDNFEIPPAMLEHSVGISSNSIEFTALMVSAGCKCDIDTTMGTDNVEEKVRGRK